MEIKENIFLADYTTFKIGGSARYFLIADSEDSLREAINFAQDKKLPYFILGGGSNILVNDKGYDGVIIKINDHQLNNDGNGKIFAGAGVKLMDLVNYTIENKLTGLEWAAGIPGTIGGAVRGNAGAFGHSISESAVSLRTMRISKSRSNLAIKEYSHQNCDFHYRDSVFKRNSDIIVLVVLKLSKGDQDKSRALIKEYLDQRNKKHPLEYPSAGCVFKNPKPMSAGKLIEQCSLTGKQIGGAMVSEKHANFIVNVGHARAEDVSNLIEYCKRTVFERFGLELEEEIQYLGF